MLGKRAHPGCSARFRYFHEGKLFGFEPKSDAPMRGPPTDLDYVGRSHTPQYFWLCSSCCSAMTLQPDGDHRVIVVRKRAPQSIFVIAHGWLPEEVGPGREVLRSKRCL